MFGLSHVAQSVIFIMKSAHHNHKEVENPCPAISLLLYHSNQYLQKYKVMVYFFLRKHSNTCINQGGT